MGFTFAVLFHRFLFTLNFSFWSAESQARVRIVAEFRSRSGRYDDSAATPSSVDTTRNENIYYRDQKITQVGDRGSLNYGIPENYQPSVDNDASQDNQNYRNNQAQLQYQAASASSGNGYQIQAQTQYQSSSGNSGGYQTQSQIQTYSPNQNQVANNNNYVQPAYESSSRTQRPDTETLITSNKHAFQGITNQQAYPSQSDQNDIRKQQTRPNQMLQHVPDEKPVLKPNERVSVIIEYPTNHYNPRDESKNI